MESSSKDKKLGKAGNFGLVQTLYLITLKRKLPPPTPKRFMSLVKDNVHSTIDSTSFDR